MVEVSGLIWGRASASAWDFGDGAVVSNRPYASHSWSIPGTYPVVLTAYNESNPGGVSTTVTVQVVTQPIHYVTLNSVTPTAPYSSWETAATSIQQAIDASSVVGALVLVSNGVYQTGGRAVYGSMPNRVAVTKVVTVQSVNGPDVTIIKGFQVPGTTNGTSAIRCAYLANGAVLSGFTLANGATRESGDYLYEQSGGGVLCAGTGATVTNCSLVGNSANSYGGGAYHGTLNNCTIMGNRTINCGGGGLPQHGQQLHAHRQLRGCWRRGLSIARSTIAHSRATPQGMAAGPESSTLNNCTLTGNSAGYGGGVESSTLNNCTLTGNSAGSGGGASHATLNNCIVATNSATGVWWWGG